jgi:hypothetical protein
MRRDGSARGSVCADYDTAKLGGVTAVYQAS